MKEIRVIVRYHTEFGLETTWFLNRKVHREDGPALFVPWEGMKYYFMYGTQIDKEKYNHTLDEQVLGW